MAITKRTEVSQILVGRNGTMFVRETLYIEEDDVVIATETQTREIEPDADTTNETDDVKAVAAAVHTKSRKEAWAAEKAAAKPAE